MAKRTTKNFIFYRGPSMLDGAPIVAIATFNSGNSKTGSGLVQTWILREDLNPIAASQSGADTSICGDCPHRGIIEGGRLKQGSRTCYVQLRNAPRSIWACFARGGYPQLDLAEVRDRLHGKKVRLGSYGDPAAVPYFVWRSIMPVTIGHTGYTHQWRSFPELSLYCMASVDSVSEMAQAKLLGFRCFRVGNVEFWTKEKTEALCGASHEAGRKVKCEDCMACGGTLSKAKCDIVIPAHGAAKKRVQG